MIWVLGVDCLAPFKGIFFSIGNFHRLLRACGALFGSTAYFGIQELALGSVPGVEDLKVVVWLRGSG